MPSQILSQDLFRPLDHYFARLMRRLDSSGGEGLYLAALLVSRASADGHVCIDLAEHAGRPIELQPERFTTPPDLASWRDHLRNSGVVGDPGERQPLVLDHADRLYLHRYWELEQRLADRLELRLTRELEPVDEQLLADSLQRLFAGGTQQPDWQKVAAVLACYRPLTVISGGPGTGKTTTVTRLLALLQEQHRAEPLRIALTAPTGKAAARLAESIKAARQHLDCSETVRAAIPEEAATIHRLLGSRPGRVGFRHHHDNPLHLDLLVVDEASMVDLPLMARLVDALPPQARLILLGDRDQLASVEAGSVLGDICGHGEIGYSEALQRRLERVLGPLPTVQQNATSPIADSLVVLRHSYRFDAQRGIGRLAHAVNRGEGSEASQLLQQGDEQLRWHPHSEGGPGVWLTTIDSSYRDYLMQESPEQALAAFARFRVLCATRSGDEGVEQLNHTIEQTLARHGLIAPQGRWYRGRPVMITRNDYALQLFNGDIGLIWPDEKGDLRAFFSAPDGTLRQILPSRLPPHETVYAMTVHKSQGSEFDRVVMLLPRNDLPVLTRELLYTGITRSRHHFELVADLPIVQATIQRRVERSSGLHSLLWGND